nr:hypothetical protein [uncultured Flavobacterium sp.]
MHKLKGVIGIIGLIVKYSAVVMAIIKGIQVVSEELEKIDFDGDKPKQSLKVIEENE